MVRSSFEIILFATSHLNVRFVENSLKIQFLVSLYFLLKNYATDLLSCLADQYLDSEVARGDISHLDDGENKHRGDFYMESNISFGTIHISWGWGEGML